MQHRGLGSEQQLCRLGRQAFALWPASEFSEPWADRVVLDDQPAHTARLACQLPDGKHWQHAGGLQASAMQAECPLLCDVSRISRLNGSTTEGAFRRRPRAVGHAAIADLRPSSRARSTVS